MAKKINEVLFDKRTAQKHIEKGVVDPKEYADYLKSLPDDFKNADALKAFKEDENLLTFSSVESSKA